MKLQPTMTLAEEAAWEADVKAGKYRGPLPLTALTVEEDELWLEQIRKAEQARKLAFPPR